MLIKGLNKEVEEGSFITIIGNEKVLKSFFTEESCSYVINRYLNIFNGETVLDEIAFGLESKALKKDLIKRIIEDYSKKFGLTSLLNKDPFSLGSSDKVKLKLCNALAQRTKSIVLCDVLSELDNEDLEKCLKLLKEYNEKGGIIINITSNIEEALYGNDLIIYNGENIAIEGKTLSVLNEEKILKRLGIGLPFYIELSKYLIDYNLIDTYYLTPESLVGAIWKK